MCMQPRQHCLFLQLHPTSTLFFFFCQFPYFWLLLTVLPAQIFCVLDFHSFSCRQWLAWISLPSPSYKFFYIFLCLPVKLSLICHHLNCFWSASVDGLWLVYAGSTFLAFCLSLVITLSIWCIISLTVTTRQSLETGHQIVFQSCLCEKHVVSLILD